MTWRRSSPASSQTAIPSYEHDTEGPDDMPSHIRTVLTQNSLTIPIVAGELGLGTWQAVYLWEHRKIPHDRRVIVYGLVIFPT